MTFDAFLDAELDSLTQYARVLTGDPQVAHDVLANALVRAFTRWRTIEQTDNPRAYVRRIVTNCFLMERRSWWHRKTDSTETMTMLAATDPARSRVDDRSELDALLRKLPKQQRAAIVLRYYLDVSDNEIGTVLNCSSGAARTYISRGLKSMRINNTDPNAQSGKLGTPAETGHEHR